MKRIAAVAGLVVVALLGVIIANASGGRAPTPPPTITTRPAVPAPPPSTIRPPSLSPEAQPPPAPTPELPPPDPEPIPPPPEEPPPPPEEAPYMLFDGVPWTIQLTNYTENEVYIGSETYQATEDDGWAGGESLSYQAQESGSTKGCSTIDATRKIRGFFSWLWSWDDLGTFHHTVHFCWNYPNITKMEVNCYSDVNGIAVTNRGCGGSGYFYTWRGAASGGHYSFRQGDWGNCALRYGCFASVYPWIKIWVNGNGAWTQTQGGGD